MNPTDPQTASRVPPLTEGGCDEFLTTRYLPDATEEECHNQGQSAFSLGMDDDVNPYSVGTFQFDWWISGWCAGEENNEG